MPEHDHGSADSPAREAAQAADQIDRDLNRVLNDARRRYLRMRKEILAMLEWSGHPMQAGMLADGIGRQMNERIKLRDIRPVLRRMRNEGLVTTKDGDPRMYKHPWGLTGWNDQRERDQRRDERRALRRGSEGIWLRLAARQARTRQ